VNQQPAGQGHHGGAEELVQPDGDDEQHRADREQVPHLDDREPQLGAPWLLMLPWRTSSTTKTTICPGMCVTVVSPACGIFA
jgi:hypothetical protein